MADKRLEGLSPISLRIAAKSQDENEALPARRELRRRARNLRGATVPVWEKALRGPELHARGVISGSQ